MPPPPPVVATTPGPRVCVQTSLPQFPWPQVPQPTSQQPIGRDQFSSVPANLGGLLDQLRSQLKTRFKKDYVSPVVVGAGCNGFALILNGERIDPGGRHLKWQDMGQGGSMEAGELLRRLLTAAPGMYRKIVVVVSTEQPIVTNQSLSSEALSKLAAVGASGLPPALAGIPFSGDYEIRALVYEFVKRGDKAQQVPPTGRVNVVTHLQQVGLLPETAR